MRILKLAREAEPEGIPNAPEFSPAGLYREWDVVYRPLLRRMETCPREPGGSTEGSGVYPVFRRTHTRFKLVRAIHHCDPQTAVAEASSDSE
jgi:hypothetical protein